MANNNRLFSPSVFILMLLLHIGIMSILWRMPVREQGGDMGIIEFIDLGNLGGGDGQPEGSAAIALSPASPKVAEVSKPVMKPVLTKKKDADIRQKEEVKPKPKLKPTPKPQPEHKEVETKPKVESDQNAVTNSQSLQGTDNIPKNGSETGTDLVGSGQGRGLGSGTGSSGAKGSNGSGAGIGGGNGVGSSAGNPVRATGHITKPPYPPISEENREQGTVVLEILVAPGGKVSEVKVVSSSGYKRLDRAARSAAWRGRFKTDLWANYTVSVEFFKVY